MPIQVKSIQIMQSQNLSSSNISLTKLLTLIENTNDEYKKYLASININVGNNYNKQQSVGTKDKINKEILKCQQEYDKIIAKNVQIVSNIINHNDIMSLDCNMNDIKQIIENKFVKIKKTKYNAQLIQKLGNIKFSKHKDDSTSYSICQFDSKYTKFKYEGTIDCDNKHIKNGSIDGHCYGMILPDAKHVQGYSSGQHCFRMYYKNPQGPHRWLLFGIYKYGKVPKDVNTYFHETSWGIADDRKGWICCNGKWEFDKSNMSFLYSINQNQIDMFVDFDKGMLLYSIVDDKVKGRKYTFEKKFDTNIAYTVHIGFGWSGTQVQIAKINVDMFGKNKQLVQWPIENY